MIQQSLVFHRKVVCYNGGWQSKTISHYNLNLLGLKQFKLNLSEGEVSTQGHQEEGGI